MSTLATKNQFTKLWKPKHLPFVQCFHSCTRELVRTGYHTRGVTPSLREKMSNVFRCEIHYIKLRTIFLFRWSIYVVSDGDN